MGAGDSGYVDYRNLKHFLMAYGRPTNEAQATLSLWGASEYDAAEVGVDGAQKVENKGASKGKGGKTGNKGKQAAKGKGAPARAGKLSKVAPETKARGAKSEEAMRGPVGVDGPPGLNVTTIKIVVIAEVRQPPFLGPRVESPASPHGRTQQANTCCPCYIPLCALIAIPRGRAAYTSAHSPFRIVPLRRTLCT